MEFLLPKLYYTYSLKTQYYLKKHTLKLYFFTKKKNV